MEWINLSGKPVYRTDRRLPNCESSRNPDRAVLVRLYNQLSGSIPAELARPTPTWLGNYSSIGELLTGSVPPQMNRVESNLEWLRLRQEPTERARFRPELGELYPT